MPEGDRVRVGEPEPEREELPDTEFVRLGVTVADQENEARAEAD